MKNSHALLAATAASSFVSRARTAHKDEDWDSFASNALTAITNLCAAISSLGHDETDQAVKVDLAQAPKFIFKRFWIVARNNGALYGNKRHDSQESAMKEAERLARQDSADFYVLESVGLVECEKTIVVKQPTLI